MAEPSERDREIYRDIVLRMHAVDPTDIPENELIVLRGLAAARDEGRREKRWTCVHCGEVFIDRATALEHFGPSEISFAACQIDIAEYRRMEEFTARCRAEDSDTDCAMYRMRAEHDAALRREEEAGYAKGLADGRREERERCAKVALAAKLPPHYQWGRDAMEQFEFGKKRAADAIMGVPDA